MLLTCTDTSISPALSVVWSIAWHQPSAVIFFVFPQWHHYVIGAGIGLRQRLLTQHHPFLLAWMFLWGCHWLLTAGCKDALWDIAMQQAQFQSDVNNYSPTVILPKAAVSLVVFFHTCSIKATGVLRDVWQRFPSDWSCCCCCWQGWWRSPRGTLQPHVWGPAIIEAS